MALHQRRRQRRPPFPLPEETSTPSTHPRGRIRPTRRLAEAYTAVGGALLSAAKSALHPGAALLAALGLDSVGKEEVAPPLGPELVDQDGEAPPLGSDLVTQDREMAPPGSNLFHQYQETALPGCILVDQEAAPLGYVKAEGPGKVSAEIVEEDMAPASILFDKYQQTASLGSDLDKAGRIAGTCCAEIVEEEMPPASILVDPYQQTAPLDSDLDTAGTVAGTRCADIDRAFVEQKEAPIASARRRLLFTTNGPPRSLHDLIASSPAATTLPPTTSQRTRARKPHQPLWRKGGMCRDTVGASPDGRVPRDSAKSSLHEHRKADADRFLPIPTSSTTLRAGSTARSPPQDPIDGDSIPFPNRTFSCSDRRASRARGIRRHLAAVFSGVPGYSHTKSAAAAVGAAVAATVPNPPSLQSSAPAGAPQAGTPPPPPPPPPGSGGSGAAPQGAQPAAGGGTPPVPPPGPAAAVVAGPPAPNDRYFNWESNHINLAVQIISGIFQAMGLGEALKKWKAARLIIFTVCMLIALGVAGLGMMASTTDVGIHWIRIWAANLARATSTVSVVLLLIALSEPIGYVWGIIMSAIFGSLMVIVWAVGDPVIYGILASWCNSIKTWAGWDAVRQSSKACWDAVKQGAKAGWDAVKQGAKAGWDSLSAHLPQPPRAQPPRAQP